MEEFVTNDSKQTNQLGEMLAKEIQGGEIICLQGDLGAGKTTFTQGFLKGLGVQGPYTSPTFLIMKEYVRPHTNSRHIRRENKKIFSKKHSFGSDADSRVGVGVKKIYHIDAYRIKAEDMLNLGWEEILKSAKEKKDTVIIIEWAERIKKIIPVDAVWIEFRWMGENKRLIKTTD